MNKSKDYVEFICTYIIIGLPIILFGIIIYGFLFFPSPSEVMAQNIQEKNFNDFEITYKVVTIDSNGYAHFLIQIKDNSNGVCQDRLITDKYDTNTAIAIFNNIQIGSKWRESKIVPVEQKLEK